MHFIVCARKLSHFELIALASVGSLGDVGVCSAITFVVLFFRVGGVHVPVHELRGRRLSDSRV